MKKKYTMPLLSIHSNKMDIVMNNHSGKPGHGWGDNNHGHDGPPGQHHDDEYSPVKERNSFDNLWK